MFSKARKGFFFLGISSREYAKLFSFVSQKFGKLMISDAVSTDVSWCIIHEAPRGTPYNGLYGEVSPERRTFFRLQVCEHGEKVRDFTSWSERVRKSHSWGLRKSPKGLTDDKTFWFCDWFLSEKTVHIQLKRRGLTTLTKAVWAVLWIT